MKIFFSVDLRPVPRRLRQEILSKADHRCVYCGRPATVVDHVTPLSRGGHSLRDNLVASCVQCNSSKGDRRLDEWRPDEWVQCDRTCQHDGSGPFYSSP